jgi:rhodanese-related sulfurtransferase
MPIAVWYPCTMPVATLRDLDLEEAAAHVGRGAAYVDLRHPRAYLDVHIPASLDLAFETGPGMPSRARDCLPLDLPLILLSIDDERTALAAASLQGKGFSVVGALRHGVDRWARAHGAPASTEVVDVLEDGVTVVDVGDPGAHAPDGATKIPAELLWTRAAELTGSPVVVIAGFGVRAALAVGILERVGCKDVSLMWTRRT